MENYALAIANYFVRLAKTENKIIRPLKLMKLVYIAHGYILAMLDKPTDGAKLEKVEAWQYGPVFPSVYYSFKDYGRNPIERETSVIDFSRLSCQGNIQYTPELTNEEEKKVCMFVWKMYGKYTDSTLVSALHAEGTPWKKMFQEGKNIIIPDSLTKKHYENVIENTLKNAEH